MKFILIQFHLTFNIYFTLCLKSLFFVIIVYGEHQTLLVRGGSRGGWLLIVIPDTLLESYSQIFFVMTVHGEHETTPATLINVLIKDVSIIKEKCYFKRNRIIPRISRHMWLVCHPSTSLWFSSFSPHLPWFPLTTAFYWLIFILDGFGTILLAVYSNVDYKIRKILNFL